MYKVSYSEILDDRCETLRGREVAAINHAIDLMRGADGKDRESLETREAVSYVQRLWTFFIEDLSHPDNALAEPLKNDLISIGIWTIAEADRILSAENRNFSTLIYINQTIRDGLA